MKTFSIENARNSASLATSAKEASSFLTRARGLIGTRVFHTGDGLIIRPCKMVHMFFMAFPIDVIFCRRDGTVLSIVENLQPWKLSRHEPESSFVVELPVGMARLADLQPGDLIRCTAASGKSV